MVQTQNLKPLIIITGPTCSGKSSLAIKLALKTGGEIISCDSMQIYKYMDIGTAKPTKEQQAAVRHHMLDIAEPDCDYSVSLYRDGADECIRSIQNGAQSGKAALIKGVSPAKTSIEQGDTSSRRPSLNSMPAQKNGAAIVTGGTGLYIRALLYPQSFGNAPKDEKIRARYETVLREKGKEYLFSLLEKTDPAAARKLHMNDTKRVIRALEIAAVGGRPKSESAEADLAGGEPRYPHKIFILNPGREKLYMNINLRVDDMIKAGLIEETEGLLRRGYTENLNSMKAIGYAETIRYLKGEADKAGTVELIKRNTRRYAKRQITFFKGFKDAVWLDTDSLGEKQCIQTILQQSL